MIENNKYYLISTNMGFYGPDGEQYQAVWGKAKIVNAEEKFKFKFKSKSNRHSVNWYVEVGEGEQSIIIAGCQINYAIQLKEKPIIKTGTYKVNDKMQPLNSIYIAENYCEYTNQNIRNVEMKSIVSYKTSCGKIYIKRQEIKIIRDEGKENTFLKVPEVCPHCNKLTTYKMEIK